MTIDEDRDLSRKHPEIGDLTRPENERDAQAHIQSHRAQVEHSVGDNNGTGPIEGMENVVVTVSGYKDVLRARLINLISTTGASYTGSLTKVNTHVVCWKFRGAKYEMAKKLGKSRINHCWFEACRKAGKRLPEGPYTASGEMAEPLCWDQSSSVEHLSSTAGFDDNYLSSGEHSRGPARSALVIGSPSTHSGTRGDLSCRSVLLSRNESIMLDRGKRHVDLNTSANRLHGGNLETSTRDCQDTCQIRPSTRSGVSPAIDLSTPHNAQEQESDEFWNEAIRLYDDRNNPVTERSCQFASKANHRAGLMENRTGTTRRSVSPTPGSSLRELDLEVHDQPRSGRKNAIANEAGSSGVAQGEVLQEAMPSLSLVGEQSGSVHSENDLTTNYPEVFQRKRRHASALAKVNFTRFKRQALARSSEASSVLGDLPNQVGRGASNIKCVAIGAAQERASTLDAKDDCQGCTGAGVVDGESAGKAGEKGGDSTCSNEIACVICHSDSKPITEGVLACGHQFCYPCIQRWADEVKAKSPTCPLCKVPFDFITFREMGKAGEDGSCVVLEERIVQIGYQTVQETCLTNLPSLRTENLCVICGSRDTPELLLICTRCGERACHTFCLDPPRPPGSFWFCNRCSEMHSRMQTREAYGRLFQVRSPQSSARLWQDIPDVGMNLAAQSRTGNHVGALFAHQSSATPLGMNLAPQSGSTSHVGGLPVGLSSATPRRRGRQNSLYNFLVRRNDV